MPLTDEEGLYCIFCEEGLPDEDSFLDWADMDMDSLLSYEKEMDDEFDDGSDDE